MANLNFVSGIPGGSSLDYYIGWSHHAVATVGNVVLPYFGGNWFAYFMAYQNPPANGDTREQKIYLNSGTYDFKIIGERNNNRGIVDYYIDAAKIFTYDWYNAMPIFNDIASQTGIIVANSGMHIFKTVVNGKNVGSSGYFYLANQFWFTKT